jgi:hypothetical protein
MTIETETAEQHPLRVTVFNPADRARPFFILWTRPIVYLAIPRVEAKAEASGSSAALTWAEASSLLRDSASPGFVVLDIVWGSYTVIMPPTVGQRAAISSESCCAGPEQLRHAWQVQERLEAEMAPLVNAS